MIKGIAVPYVIALILGIAIVGIVGYWFVGSGGKFSGASQSVYCQNKVVEHCTRILAGASGSFPTECGSPLDLEKCKGVLGIAPSGSSPTVEPPPKKLLDDECTPASECDDQLVCVRKEDDSLRVPRTGETGLCKGAGGYDTGEAGHCGNDCAAGSCALSSTICSVPTVITS